jgi:hypothetical protein
LIINNLPDLRYGNDRNNCSFTELIKILQRIFFNDDIIVAAK